MIRPSHAVVGGISDPLVLDESLTDDVIPEDQLSLMDEVADSSGVLPLGSDVPALGAAESLDWIARSAGSDTGLTVDVS